MMQNTLLCNNETIVVHSRVVCCRHECTENNIIGAAGGKSTSFLLPSAVLGMVLGLGGSKLEALRRVTGAKVKIHGGSINGETKVSIRGKEGAKKAAFFKIKELVESVGEEIKMLD